MNPAFVRGRLEGLRAGLARHLADGCKGTCEWYGHETVAFLLDVIAQRPEDDPMLDATDWAHPAWWRGHEHTTQVFCDLVHKILDGRDDGAGANHEPWQTLRRRLLALVSK